MKSPALTKIMAGGSTWLRKASLICSGVSAATLASSDLVEFQRAVETLAGGEQADQCAILRAAHDALLEPGFLGGSHFVRGEAVLQRLGEFVAEAGFHLGRILRSADSHADEGAAIVLG